jgi:hypothetical protein
MTTAVNKPLLGASSKAVQWSAIHWRATARQVQRLQKRIAKATRENRWGKVNALQWLLTHSFTAKCLAVRRVTPMCRVTGSGQRAFVKLEPCAVKIACTVLRGGNDGNVVPLPDNEPARRRRSTGERRRLAGKGNGWFCRLMYNDVAWMQEVEQRREQLPRFAYVVPIRRVRHKFPLQAAYFRQVLPRVAGFPIR